MTPEHRANLSRAHKGHIPWNKGIPRSEETKLKISQAHKGVKLSAEHRLKISKSLIGKPSRAKGKKWSEEARRKLSESNSGANNPMFGRVQTPETREKIGNANRSKKPSIEARAKMSMAARKVKVLEFDGFISSEKEKARQDFRQQVHSQVLRRDNYTCQICEQYGGYLNVDHIKSWAEYPELRHEISNCRTLCQACHYYITFKRKMPKLSKWGILSRKEV